MADHPFINKVFYCYKCGHFVAKIAKHGITATARMGITVVCKNSRCRADNVLHLDKGEVTVKDPIQWGFEYPGIIEKIGIEEKEATEKLAAEAKNMEGECGTSESPE